VTRQAAKKNYPEHQDLEPVALDRRGFGSQPFACGTLSW
jgi:hypothetical protein